MHIPLWQTELSEQRVRGVVHSRELRAEHLPPEHPMTCRQPQLRGDGQKSLSTVGLAVIMNILDFRHVSRLFS